MSEVFILIETATQACSAAIAIDGKVVKEKYIAEIKAHAKELVPFVKELLDDNNLTLNDCSAISVSSGPGSYTGLRVGVSTAKGFCFGASLPLISIGTLDILAQMAIDSLPAELKNNQTAIIPMIDARRMEVYSALFDIEGKQLSKTEAVILDENSYSNVFNKYSQIVFIGDGAEKSKSAFTQEQLSRSTFISILPKASAMLSKTKTKWNNKDFEDCAYFEPFYLKEFVAGISKKSIL